MKNIIILTTLIFFAPNLVSDSYEDEVRKRLGLKGQICKQDESCGVKSMPGVGVKSNKTELVAVSEGRDGKTVYDLGCACLLYTSPSPRDQRGSRMPSSA